MRAFTRSILISVILFSCINNADFKISADQQKGINDIVSFYGGYCEYGIKKEITSSKKKSTFWIKFSKSPAIDSLAEYNELHCSNMAYLFYKNLNKETRGKYDYIQAEVTNSNGDTHESIFSIRQLEQVNNVLPVVNKIVELLRQKKFEEIEVLLSVDSSVIKYDKNILIQKIKEAETEYPTPVAFILYGFKYRLINDTKETLKISGAISRGESRTEFSILLDPDVNQNKVYALNYKL